MMYLIRIALFLFLYWSSTRNAANGQSSCDVVLIDGTDSAHHTSGLYQQGDTCNSKPVFNLVNGNMYLYFVSDDVFIGWMAGPVACVNQGGVSVASTADHPADVTGAIWEEVDTDTDSVFNDNNWVVNPSIDVTCSSLTFEGCDPVRLSGTDYNDDFEGNYDVLSSSEICYGKFSYKMSSGLSYLYFHTGTWVISDYNCHRYVYLEALDGAFYPEQITGSWVEHTTVGTLTNYDVSISCSGSRMMVDLSVLAAVLLSISVFKS